CGPLIQKYRQIGEAVSPVFSEAIARHLLGEWDATQVTDDPDEDIRGPFGKSFASRIASLKGFRWPRALASRKRDRYRVPMMIDCFCGAGGLSLGLQAAGFRTQYAFDSDRYAIETYRNNISAAVECVDAGNILAAEVLRRHGLVRGECVLVAGGPPCQG